MKKTKRWLALFLVGMLLVPNGAVLNAEELTSEIKFPRQLFESEDILLLDEMTESNEELISENSMINSFDSVGESSSVSTAHSILKSELTKSGIYSSDNNCYYLRYISTADSYELYIYYYPSANRFELLSTTSDYNKLVSLYFTYGMSEDATAEFISYENDTIIVNATATVKSSSYHGTETINFSSSINTKYSEADLQEQANSLLQNSFRYWDNFLLLTINESMYSIGFGTSTVTPMPTSEPEPTIDPSKNNTPTPIPTATNTPSPVPTSTVTPTPTATNTPTPVPTATNVPTATPIPTATNTPTPEPTATVAPIITPALGPTTTVTPIPVPSVPSTPTPAIIPTSTPIPTEIPNPTATPTPKPTATPIPTQTEEPEELPLVTITGFYNSVKGADIRWTKVPGASGYYIYRKRSADGTKIVKVINDPNVTQCFDSEVQYNCWGRVYVYYVIPFFGGDVGKKSNEVTLQRLAPMYFTGFKNNSAGKVDLTWACTVSENKSLGYEIQYATSKTDLFARTGSFRKVSVNGRNNLKKTISGLTKGQTYYFRIRCYVDYTHSVTGKQTKTWSQYSDVVSVKITK